eukprot:5204895-Prymnesium_polylepis.1
MSQSRKPQQKAQRQVLVLGEAHGRRPRGRPGPPVAPGVAEGVAARPRAGHVRQAVGSAHCAAEARPPSHQPKMAGLAPEEGRQRRTPVRGRPAGDGVRCAVDACCRLPLRPGLCGRRDLVGRYHSRRGVAACGALLAALGVAPADEPEVVRSRAAHVCAPGAHRVRLGSGGAVALAARARQAAADAATRPHPGEHLPRRRAG